MLRPSEDTLQTPDTSTLARVGRSGTSRINKPVSRSVSHDRTATDIQIVLVTPGGLELPLVESPGQTARLLEVVSEMAADTDGDRPRRTRGLAGPKPRRVRADQVFDRVRVVVRRDTSVEGGDAA